MESEVLEGRVLTNQVPFLRGNVSVFRQRRFAKHCVLENCKVGMGTAKAAKDL
jgi:hypothetical protein